MLWENIPEKNGERDLINFGNCAEVEKYSCRTLKNPKIPYDFGSIMHYPRERKVKEGPNKGLTKPTLRPKDTQLWREFKKKGKTEDDIGQRVKLSPRDIKSINQLYKCKKLTVEQEWSV